MYRNRILINLQIIWNLETENRIDFSVLKYAQTLSLSLSKTIPWQLITLRCFSLWSYFFCRRHSGSPIGIPSPRLRLRFSSNFVLLDYLINHRNRSFLLLWRFRCIQVVFSLNANPLLFLYFCRSSEGYSINGKVRFPGMLPFATVISRVLIYVLKFTIALKFRYFCLFKNEFPWIRWVRAIYIWLQQGFCNRVICKQYREFRILDCAKY